MHGNGEAINDLTTRPLFPLQNPGRSRGFGFVVFESVNDANTAISKTNESEWFGRFLRVNLANEKPREQRGTSYGGGGGDRFGGGGGGYGGGGGGYGGGGGGGGERRFGYNQRDGAFPQTFPSSLIDRVSYVRAHACLRTRIIPCTSCVLVSVIFGIETFSMCACERTTVVPVMCVGVCSRACALSRFASVCVRCVCKKFTLGDSFSE